MDSPVNKKPEAGRRVRRTPALARQVILDAAEACMGAEGPAGLRLTQVAARAGVSHPALLHHFGSREALVAAVHARAVERMRNELGAMMQASRAGSGDIVGRVFEAYRTGLAERLVWMLQSGVGIDPAGGRPALAEMVDGLQALRLEIAPPGIAPSEAETRRIVHLIVVVAFGDALIGSRLRAGPDEAADRAAFGDWFSGLVDRLVAPWRP